MNVGAYVTCGIISSLSLVVNCFLLRVYFHCPLQMISTYKYFFLLTAIYDIIFSGCLILLFPTNFTQDYSMVYLATGPLNKPLIGQPLMLLFCSAYITSLLIVTNSFVYRYLQLCKSTTFQNYLTPRGFSIAILANTLVFMNWGVISRVALWPSTLAFDGRMSNRVPPWTMQRNAHVPVSRFHIHHILTMDDYYSTPDVSVI
ncbi:hypothetical protein COOONC_06462 [Cooperia oncophora]